MDHTSIPRLEVRPSRLGYGCMRFPTRKDGKIARREAKRLLDRAWEAGVNYFDTAYFYHKGESESFTSSVLSRHPRDSYYLTSKLPTVLVHSLEDAKRIFAQQQERLQHTDLDFYLLHNLNGPRWREMVEAGVVDWCLELQRQGRFRHFGFSFHGSYEEFEEILTARQWDVCQIQLNYMDTEEQAGMKGYALTEKLGVPLIVMEPVKGGALAAPPAEVTELFQKARPGASPASWALHWVGSLPNVMTVLSGMSTLEQVEDNLDTFTDFRPLSGEEAAVVQEAARRFRQRVKNGCTGCRYCMPCPAGVDIPGTFQTWNQWGLYGQQARTEQHWRAQELKTKPVCCVGCGVCEAQCPQKLPIRADLKRAQAELDGVHEA